MEDRQVVIYSGPGCGRCIAAKAYFKKNNIDYIDFDIRENDAAMAFLANKGVTSIPFIIIGDFEAIGFNEYALDKELGINANKDK